MKNYKIRFFTTFFLVLVSFISNAQTSSEGKEEESPFFKRSGGYEQNKKFLDENYEIKDENPLYIHRVKKESVSKEDTLVKPKYVRQALPVSKPNEITNHKPASDSSATLPIKPN